MYMGLGQVAVTSTGGNIVCTGSDPNRPSYVSAALPGLCVDQSTGAIVSLPGPAPVGNTPSVGIPGYDLPAGVYMDQSNGYPAPVTTQPAQGVSTSPAIAGNQVNAPYTQPAQLVAPTVVTPSGVATSTTPTTTTDTSSTLPALLLAAAVGLMFLL